MAEGRAGLAEAGTEVGAGSAFLSRDFRLDQTARLLVILGAEAQYRRGGPGRSTRSLIIRRSISASPGWTIFAPGFFFMLAAGHVADRYDRRSVILACYSLQALCTLALIQFALHPTGRVWPIYAVLFGVGTGRAFSSPASAAFLPSLVPSNHFVNAVIWGSMVFQVANIAGPAVGGLLFTLRLKGVPARWNGGAAVYTFALLTLLAFLVLVGMMRTRPVRVVKNAFNLETMLAGFKYVLGQAAAWVVLAGPVCRAAGRRHGAAAHLCR